jgi:hypothetical protein
MSVHVFFVLFYAVYVAALQGADPQSRESYRLSTIFTISEFILNGNRPEHNPSRQTNKNKRKEEEIR